MFSVFVLGINIYVIDISPVTQGSKRFTPCHARQSKSQIYPISSWAERVISPVTPDSKSHTK